MTLRKNIKSKQQWAAALALEKTGELNDAIKLYQKAVQTNPLNVQAWNRLMIGYRKSKSKAEEVKLIKSAIAEYQKATELKHKDWLQTNRTKADDSRELAKVMGLLEPNGLPVKDDNNVEKWQTRLYLLEYRIKNARNKKPTVPKKSAQRKQVVSKAKVEVGSAKQKQVKKKRA